MSTPEQISETIRPEVQEAVGERARLVQAVPNMLEVLPVGASKVWQCYEIVQYSIQNMNGALFHHIVGVWGSASARGFECRQKPGNGHRRR